MRRRRALSVASKILGRGASSSPPPSQFPCPRTTPTTPTRSTMSTHCSAQSGRTRALAPQGRPLDRLKVNHAWFLFAISPLHSSLSHSVSLLSLFNTKFLSFCDLTSIPPVLPSLRPSVRLFVSPCVCVFVCPCDVCSKSEQFHICLTVIFLFFPPFISPKAIATCGCRAIKSNT